MRLIAAIVSVFIFSFVSLSQIPAEVTPLMQQKIKVEVEKEAVIKKAQLQKDKVSDADVEFTLDTFRVERFMKKYLELDYSDAGMNQAGYETAKQYDSLLNKYYKKLLVTLKGDDKKILVQAQKAWIAFRDSESKLLETISKDEYSGGGTIQRLAESSEYLEMVKNRVLAIFSHYLRATQNY